MRVLVVDNYDSFTWNLVQYLQILGAEVDVVKNDAMSSRQLLQRPCNRVVISPGPCDPDRAGISLDVVKRCAGTRPLLGVCLGHQAIGQSFGGRIVPARTLMHGKTSPIYHTGTGVFRGLPSPFRATRYHSLALDSENLPPNLEVTAWTDDGEIMGIRHKTLAVEGVQFHPESVISEYGLALLENFLSEDAP